MCIPKAPAPQAVQQQPLAPLVPQTQAASAIQLGGSAGVPRGAAALGRLQLRLSGEPSAASSSSAQPTDITANPQVNTGGMTLGDAGNIGGSGVQRYSAATNPNLRLA